MNYLFSQMINHKTSLAIVSTIYIVFFICIGNSFALDSLYFIYGQPGTDLPNKLPFPTAFYCLDINNKSLAKIWSTDKHVRTINILNLVELKKVILLEDYNKLRIFQQNNIPQNAVIDLKYMEPLSRDFYYIKRSNGSDIIVVKKLVENPNKYPALSFQYINISVENGEEVADADLSKSEYDLKLSGPVSRYSNGTSNVLSIHIGSKGDLLSTGPVINLRDFIIPHDLIYMDSSLGWSIIANNSSYLAILSAPHRHGLDKRELLVFNKMSNKWSSILMDGPQTIPVIKNNWMAGVIADTDPETDFITRKGLPPILREEIVLINPLDNKQFNVRLGKNAEVLWIEGSDVYYRIDDHLYKARIENNDFVNRQLLLVDERVKHFHWAFSGKSDELINQKNIE